MIAHALGLVLLTAPPEPPPPVAKPSHEQTMRFRLTHEQRRRSLFIASGVMFGLAFVGETTGAIVASTCELGRSCAIGLTFTWGSDSAGTRYTVFSTGPGSPYVISRVAAIPFVSTGVALLLTGAHLEGDAAAHQPDSPRITRRTAWALTGTGLGIYAASRLMRLGFAIAGVCQDPRCVYGFDQATLGSSRALAFPGSAMLIYLRSRDDARIGLVPFGTFGLGLAGEF